MTGPVFCKGHSSCCVEESVGRWEGGLQGDQSGASGGRLVETSQIQDGQDVGCEGVRRHGQC